MAVNHLVRIYFLATRFTDGEKAIIPGWPTSTCAFAKRIFNSVFIDFIKRFYIVYILLIVVTITDLIYFY